MKKLRWLLGLGLASLSLAGCLSPAPRTVKLSDLFERSRTRSIVSGGGPLGAEGWRPFRAPPDLMISDGQWIPGAKVELSFYLHKVQPLRLTLEVESPGDRQVLASLGGQKLGRQTLRQGTGVADFEVSADILKPGRNTLTLKTSPEVRWRNLMVEPLLAALSSKTGQVQRPGLEGTSLLLPFGQPLAVPLPPQGASTLSFALQPWTDDGVAPLAEGSWGLKVSSRQDNPSTLASTTINGLGPHSVSLPPCQEAAVLELSLEHQGEHGPLPGQLGLRLVEAKLEMPATLSSPSPSTTTSQVVVQGADSVTLGSLKFLATPPALYDLARDPDQQQNLLTSRPATALHLESVLIERSAGASKADSVDDATLRNLRTLEYLR